MSDRQLEVSGILPHDGTPEPDVSLAEFFDPGFMARYSEFSSFAEFCEASPWAIDDRTDLDAVPRDDLDDYVARTTDFDSWRRMRNRAATREVRDRLLV